MLRGRHCISRRIRWRLDLAGCVIKHTDTTTQEQSMMMRGSSGRNGGFGPAPLPQMAPPQRVGMAAASSGRNGGFAPVGGFAAGSGLFGPSVGAFDAPSSEMQELRDEVQRFKTLEQPTVTIQGRTLHKVSYSFLAANIPEYAAPGATCDGCSAPIAGESAVWHAMPQGAEAGGCDCCAACALQFLPPAPAPVAAAPEVATFGAPMSFFMAAASSGRGGGFGPAASQRGEMGSRSPSPDRAGMFRASSGRDGGFGSFGGAS